MKTLSVYPSYFKLQVRWLHSLTPVTYLCTYVRSRGFVPLPPSCNSNYLGYRAPLVGYPGRINV
ncbi:hypothetical protein FP362_05505 [Enterobacter hormaechei]|nr:hypothetical protein [Enterobacter hormaechei]MBY5147691.1 hypothetical protein [Enterobacter hormaechei]MPV46951.1 hypothetical protein [Enterobacter hormaechei]QFH85610.1 hypothetical protein FR760_12225 [Enterobacter hormaechei]